MAGTKQIQGARVVVLRLDGVDAADAAEGLKSLGMVHAVGVSHPSELEVHIEGGKVDVVIVARRGPQGAVPLAPTDTPLPPEAAVKAGIPCLLLVPGATRAFARTAMSRGFAAVMSADAAPRLIYRRVGALMQRVRRIGRAQAEAGTPV